MRNNKIESWINNIKVVGFDLDGTLYPPGSIPSELIEGARLKQIRDMNGWDDQRTKREYETIYLQLGSHTKTMTALGVDGEKFSVNLWDELALENYIHKDGRVVKMLKSLENKSLRLFVLSNSNRADQIERKLRLIGIDPELFEVLVSTVGMEAVKPDARPFLETLSRLDEIDPNLVLYVGDREKTDILGAKNVGMRTCMVWGKSELADVSLPTVYDTGELFI